MPIYAYRCDACGHAQDVLQKISDPVLSTCPVCGAAAFKKQLTAAGFQLKGSGWYATDFRNGSGTKPVAATGAGDAASASGSPAASPAPAPAGGDGGSSASAASPPASAAGGCGSSCACH